MDVKINLITRCSRKDNFIKTLNSLNNQTYKNVKHFITYQNDEIFEFLKSIDFKYETELVRVPNLKKIDNLTFTYELDDIRVDYLNPNWNYLDRKIVLNDKEFYQEKKKIENRKKVDVIKYEKNGFWCSTLNSTLLRQSRHFPYNLFLKIAEQKINDGWIMYLDDDDTINEIDGLESLCNEIIKYDEDTLHVFKIKRIPDTVPSDHFFNYYRVGHPLMYGEIGGGCLIFHSKYKDYTVWDEWTNADYRTAKVLEKVIPNKNFFDKVVIDATLPGVLLK